MADARVDAVCDLVAAALAAKLPIGDSTPFDADTPTAIVVDPSSPDVIVGRKVFVFPAAYSQIEQLTRANELNGYLLRVLVVNRFTDPGPATKAWTRAQKKWVQDQVYDVAQPSRMDERLLADYWCQTAGVMEVCDPDKLRAHRLFWSEIDLEFRIIE